MKSFRDFREECGCDDKKKEPKSKKLKNKKSGNVEVMPIINDGKKGMVTKPTNESNNYQGPLYAPWSAVVKGRGFDPIEERKLQTETFESGVAKARRDHRSGTLLTFKQFLSKLTDILDEWEK